MNWLIGLTDSNGAWRGGEDVLTGPDTTDRCHQRHQPGNYLRQRGSQKSTNRPLILAPNRLERCLGMHE
jgi:hypothetical protein